MGNYMKIQNLLYYTLIIFCQDVRNIIRQKV